MYLGAVLVNVYVESMLYLIQRTIPIRTCVLLPMQLLITIKKTNWFLVARLDDVLVQMVVT